MTKILSFTFNPVQENTFIVYDEDSREAIIIDPGCFSTAEEQALVAAIEERELKPVKLINTHCHFDHIYGNAFVASKYGLELGVHPLEVQIIEIAPLALSRYGLPPMMPCPKPGYFINEGDEIKLGEANFEALFCPGHSPGSLCFLNRAEGYVIAGDVLFDGSIGRTDLPFCDHEALIGSILTKLMPLPDQTVVYPGHGGPTTIGKERGSNPWLGGARS